MRIAIFGMTFPETSKNYLQHLIKKIVSIGRVKWIPGTKSVGKDNCCWYLFDRYYDGVIKFYGKK